MANDIKINSPMSSKPQQKKGSGFVNLGKVLQANVNNKLGQTVAQGVGAGAQQVQQGLGQLKSGFLQEADKQNLASVANKQAVSEALQRIAGGQTDLTEDQIKQFGTFRAGQYAGPKELDPTKTVQIGAKAQETEQFGKALSSQGDKGRLLQTFAGKGPYSAGQSRLDSLLLGKGPGAKEQLAQAKQQTRGLTQQVGKEQEAAQQIGQLRTGQAQEFGQQVTSDIATQEGGINTALEQALVQAPAQREALKRQYEQALISKDLSQFPELQAQLANARLYNANPFSALEQGQDATKQNIASLGQRSQLEALSKLAGKDPKTLGFAPDVYDPSKAVQLNVQKLKQLIGSAEQEYQQKLNSPYYKLTPERAAALGSSPIPEMQALLDKYRTVGLSIPERLRMAELQGGGIPGNDFYERETKPYREALEAFKTREGYYQQFK